ASFNNLTVNKSSGILSLASGTNASLASSLNITAGTLNANNNNISIAGNWTRNNTASFNPGTGTITFNGTGAQAITITGGGTASFNNLTINNSNGVSLNTNTNCTIDATLNLSSGTFTVGANTLTLNGGAIAGTPSLLATTSSSTLEFGGSNAGPLAIPSSVINIGSLNIGNTNNARVDINSSFTVHNTLTLGSGTLSIGSNTLTIAGNISNGSGRLRGSTSSNINCTYTSGTKELYFDRSTEGTTNVLQNLTINGTGGTTTLGDVPSNGSGIAQLYITETLTVTAGTLDLTNSVADNHIVLVSDGTNQARIANVAGTINQGTDTKIVVERFVNGTRRAWRFITAPLTGNGSSINRTIQYQWQNHQTNPANTLGGTSFGININGPSGSTGMDEITPGYTLRGWDYSTRAYVNISNTTSEMLFGTSATAANKP
ncbi:MAG: hypothetical protein ACOVOV_07130, partial [Dolichospermum sp.]